MFRSIMFRSISRMILFAILMPGSAIAQSYPSKPIRWVLPIAPGGIVDTVARVIAPGLSEKLGTSIVVDNRPGGGTILGTDIVAKSPPDGYTILLTSSALVVNPTLSKLPYDPAKDLAPVIQLAVTPMVLVVHPSMPVRNMKEFLAHAKANPGKLNYGTPGTGTTLHLTTKLLEEATGIEMVDVNYKGTGPMLNDLFGGQLQLSVSTPIEVIPHIRSGRLRAIAVTGDKRISALPDVPTMIEGGLPFEASVWMGVLAPSGTPKEIVARLNSEFNKVLQLPEVSERLSGSSVQGVGGTPEQFAALIKTDLPKWAAIIKKANIKIE